MTIRRGLPPVRICRGRISRPLVRSPLATVHSRAHSPAPNGSRPTIRNISKNGCLASSKPSNRLVEEASSMIWGSDCSTARSFQPRSLSPFRTSDCMFSTMSTSFLPSRSVALRTVARALSSVVRSRQRAASSAWLARSSRASPGFLRALALARWNSVSSQKSAMSKISGLSSMNRTGISRWDSSLSVRTSAATLASSMVFPRPRGATMRTCWQDGESMFPRTMSSTVPSSCCLTTNCSITSSSDWNVPGLNLRIGRATVSLIPAPPPISRLQAAPGAVRGGPESVRTTSLAAGATGIGGHSRWLRDSRHAQGFRAFR